MKGGEKMKISTNQIQQSIQGMETKKKEALEGKDIDFLQIMLQIITMMNMNVRENQGNESSLSQNANTLEQKNIQQEILMNTIKALDLDIEDFKSNKISHELIQIVEEIVTAQDNQLSKDQIVNLQNNDELNKILEKIDRPLEKLLTELKDMKNSHGQEEKLESLDISRTNRIISFLQEKTENDSKDIKFNTNKESILGENLKDAEGKLIKVKETGEINEKSIGSLKELNIRDIRESKGKDISTNNSLSIFDKLDLANKPQHQVEIKNMHEITKEMIKEIKVLKNGKQSNLQLKLRPKELGEIEIKLEMKAGEVVGKILVESMAVKGAIENQLQHLKEQLRNQNILIQEVEVDLQQHSQRDNPENRQTFFNEDNLPNYVSRQAYGEDDVAEVMGNAWQPLVVNSYYSRGQASSLNILA
jgi:flagellar hook-length control protein FliK